MSFDIFQVDWILVDGIIIIVLILILILVKVIKLITRWRYKLVNENLDETMYEGKLLHTGDDPIKIYHWNYIRKVKGSNGSSDGALVLILRTKRKKSWVQAILEGLASFGLNVIDLKFEVLDSEKSTDVYLAETISSILEYMDYKPQSKSYFSLTFQEDPIHTLLKTENCQFQILINPKFKSFDFDMVNDQHNSKKFHLIFSEFSFKFIKNLQKRKINVEKRSYISIVENSNRNFKYHETILLGILIELVSKNMHF